MLACEVSRFAGGVVVPDGDGAKRGVDAMLTHRGFTITAVMDQDGTWRAIIRRQDHAPITFQGATLPEFQTHKHTMSEDAVRYARDATRPVNFANGTPRDLSNRAGALGEWAWGAYLQMINMPSRGRLARACGGMS